MRTNLQPQFFPERLAFLEALKELFENAHCNRIDADAFRFGPLFKLESGFCANVEELRIGKLHGGVVAWHQDYSYWTRTLPMAHLTCWIGLDDSTLENGCLYYVPGSHRWNLLPQTGLAGDMDEIMTVLTPEQKAAFHPIPIELKRGECSFHHPLMVHGSYANYSDRPRRATIVNAFRDGVKSATDEELLVGVPIIPKDAPMLGQFFPMLFDPQAAGVQIS